MEVNLREIACYISNDSDPRQLLQAKTECSAQAAQTQINHSRILHAQYQQTWLLKDVEERIILIRNALALLSNDEPDLAAPNSNMKAQRAANEDVVVVTTCVYDLSIALRDRYKHTGQLDDLNELVALLRLASRTLPRDSTLAISTQGELGAALRSRFLHAGDTNDILEALQLHTLLLGQHPKDSPNLPWLLYNLAHTLYVRSTRSGDDEEITRCIAYLNQAIDGFPEFDPCRYMAQYILATALWTRHIRGGNVSFLHDASALYRDIIRSQPPNHPDRWWAYFGLGCCAGFLYENHNGPRACLDETVEYAQHAFHIIDPRNPNRGRVAANLGTSLCMRYTRLGAIEDLHEGIRILQSCVDISHASHVVIKGRLSVCLSHRYDALGAIEDLDESIRLNRGLVAMAPSGHPDRHRYLICLADDLQKRYRRDKRKGDFNESADMHREVLSLSPDPWTYAFAVFNIAESLCSYHEDTGDKESLEEAIALCKAWLEERQGDNQEIRAWFLHTYAKAVTLRYELYHHVGDLNTAISRYEQALGHYLAGDADRHTSLIELAVALSHRFEVSHRAEDIERAADLLMDARACLPDGHTDRATPLFKLSRLYLCEAAPFFDIRTALEHAGQAIAYGYQNAQKRLTNALDVLKHLKRHQSTVANHPELLRALLDIYSIAIGLLPRVAYFGLGIVSRLHALGASDQLAVDGAVQALVLNQPQIAVELLEQGRAVFWSQHLRLRTEFNSLPSELAEKLAQTASVIEINSYTREEEDAPDSSRAQAAQEMETAKKRRLGEEFEALIAQTRSLPGFERFMLPERFQALSEAASQGPVVVLLANDITCQAVVMENPETVHQVHLPDISLQQLRTLSQAMAMAVRHGRKFLRDRAMKQKRVTNGRNAEELLAELWRKIIQVIVDALQLKKSIGRDRPRVMLCPTGVFAHLPLHAAGLYNKDQSTPSECCSDYFVPSYTPTIGALLNARRKLSSSPISEAKVLLAAVPKPFGKWPRLPSVADEVKHIITAIPSQVLVDVIGDVSCAEVRSAAAATASTVLAKLPEVTILHLACHGHQDPHCPLESGFVMQDMMLTVSKLMSLNLDKAFLAFLSACETAKGDKVQPDQAIHLAATMLFAGFKSVVGTMWSMDDFDGPIVAQTVYEELFRDGGEVLDPDAVPYALDLAVQKMRAKGLSASRWAPYIHLGV